jgi:hypothetical protein
MLPARDFSVRTVKKSPKFHELPVSGISLFYFTHFVLSLYSIFVDAKISVFEATVIESEANSRAVGCNPQSCGQTYSNQSRYICNDPACVSQITFSLRLKVSSMQSDATKRPFHVEVLSLLNLS